MMIHKRNERDTTIEEIHQTRQRMADKFAGDIAAILDDARKRQAASGRAVWRDPSTARRAQPLEHTPRAASAEVVGSGGA
jgi:hypothetical protein